MLCGHDINFPRIDMGPVWFLWQPEAIIIVIPNASTLNFEEIETPICVIDDIGQLAIPILLSTRIESRYTDTCMQNVAVLDVEPTW